MLTVLGAPVEYAPPDRRRSYAASTSAVVSVMAAAGPLLGARIVAALDYEWLFGVSIMLSLVGAAVTRLSIAGGRSAPPAPAMAG